MRPLTSLLPSRTCLYVAAARALGARDADPAVRNPDYLAERLLGPAERILIADQACARALEQDYTEALTNMEAMSSVLMMQVRTRFIEERLAAAVREGASQVVILGAGFDTRACRLTDLLGSLPVFEVDQPSTQVYKRRRLQEAGIRIPANLRYIAVDFRHDSLDGALRAGGYDSSRVSFFIWEGVTMYLPQAAVEETLGWVASQLPGSAIVFDFVNQSIIGSMATLALDRLPEAAREPMVRIQRLEAGEPWVFGIQPGAVAEFLGKFGLTLHEVLPVGGEVSRARYLTRSDGSFYISTPAGAPASASVTNPDPPYFLAEAHV